MIPNNSTFTNRGGYIFDIRIERIKLPVEANYWKYIFLVEERSTGLKSQHRCGVMKSRVPDPTLADTFVLGDPLDYLKNALLDEFDASDGSTPLRWPELDAGWFVV